MTRQREEGRQLISDKRAEWRAKGQQAVAEEKERKARTQQMQYEWRSRNRDTGRDMRLQEAAWETYREERQAEFWKVAHERVVEANGLDARLDASEAAQDAKEREEGTRARLALSDSLHRLRTSGLTQRKQSVSTSRAESVAAVKVASAVPVRANVASATQLKQAKEGAWRRDRDAGEEAYLEQARANRQRALESRRGARAAAAAELKEKQIHAKKERGNDHLVTEEKARILEANRKEVAEVYKQRWATRRAAKSWTASRVHHLWTATPGGSNRSSTRSQQHASPSSQPGTSPDGSSSARSPTGRAEISV